MSVCTVQHVITPPLIKNSKVQISKDQTVTQLFAINTPIARAKILGDRLNPE